MHGKLKIIYTDKTETVVVYPTIEEAEEHEKGIRMALGNQIEFTCVMETNEPITDFEEEHRKERKMRQEYKAKRRKELAHKVTVTMEHFDPYSFRDTGMTIEECDEENLRLIEENPEDIIECLVNALEEMIP